MATQPILSERVRRLNLVPLITSHNATFTDWYTLGVGWSLFGKRESNGPCEEDYLLWMFEHCRTSYAFHPQHEQRLCSTIGFALGMIHGGVLLPDGTPRPDATTLVPLTSQDSVRGYQAGRDFFFLDADKDEEWHMSDDRLFAWLCDLAEEYAGYQDAVRTVRFALGTILGELSGHLFPWTPQEHQMFETRSINILGYICNINPKSLVAPPSGRSSGRASRYICNINPKSLVAIQQFAVQAVRVA